MGNPHVVFFEPDLSRVLLREWGPRIETLPIFPQRVNVHFARVVRPAYMEMVTWERGAGLTQACGTGACAVGVAGVLNGLSKRDVVIRLPAGELRIEWDEANNHVFKTGPATEVFTGLWPA
jgi:diaminopimelate epimerase